MIDMPPLLASVAASSAAIDVNNFLAKMGLARLDEEEYAMLEIELAAKIRDCIGQTLRARARRADLADSVAYTMEALRVLTKQEAEQWKAES